MERPSVVVYSSYPTSTQGTWSVSAVHAAIDAHERGDLHNSAMLADALTRISRVAGCLETRCEALISKGGDIPFDVKPSEEGDQRRAKKVAAEVKSWFWRAHPEAALKQVLADRVMLGVAFAQVVWLTKRRPWAYHLEPWHASNFCWDDVAGKWRCNTREGQILIGEDDPNWLIWEPNGSRSYLGGAVRSLGFDGVARSDVGRDWARFCERHGLPIIKVKVPSNAQQPAKDAMRDGLAGIGRQGLIQLPQGKDEFTGWDVDFLEPKDTAWEAFRAFKEALDLDITIRIKGQNLTTEVQGGSYAAARTHGRVDGMILAADAEGLATFCHRGIDRWGRFNHSFWDDVIGPWPCWETAPPEDLQARATTLVAAGTALAGWNAALAPVGQQVDAKAYAESFKMPLKAIEGGPPKPPVPAPAPGENDPETEDEDPADDPAEEPTEGEPVQTGQLAAASKARDPRAPLVRAQTYVDGVVTAAAGKLPLSTLLGEVKAAIDAGTSPDDVRARLVELAGQDIPDEAEDLIERVLMLTLGAGTWSASREAST